MREIVLILEVSKQHLKITRILISATAQFTHSATLSKTKQNVRKLKLIVRVQIKGMLDYLGKPISNNFQIIVIRRREEGKRRRSRKEEENRQTAFE